MATSIEAQGHTVDEAIQIALNQLGLSRDKVEIDILHHPRRGLLGIGARRAKVRATVRENAMADGEEFDMSGGTALDDRPRRRRRRGGRSRGGREDRPETTAEAPARGSAGGGGREAGRGEADRRGGGGGRRPEGEGGRGRGEEGSRSRDDRRGGRGRGERSGGEGRGDGQQRGGQQAQPREDGRQGGGRQEAREGGGRQEAREGGRQDGREGGRQDGRDRSSQRGRQGGGRDQGDRRDRGRQQATDSQVEVSGEAAVPPVHAPEAVEALPSSAAPARSGNLIAPKRPPVAEEPLLDAETLEAVRVRADELVREMLDKMGFAAEVTSTIDEAAGEAIVSVRSDSEGLLIGRRGQTLDSLEHILNRMVLRGESYVEGRILLDIGDYRRRRRESLEELAQRLRVRAVTERRSVQVSPMSPRDRKFFAEAFAGDEAVEVRALGAGFYRRVIVAPAGMGAAALAEAESVSSGDEEGSDSDNVLAGAEAES